MPSADEGSCYKHSQEIQNHIRILDANMEGKDLKKKFTEGFKFTAHYKYHTSSICIMTMTIKDTIEKS